MKNLTFVIGMLWLIYGALFFDYPDWDIGVSLVMGISTYVFAEVVWGGLMNPSKLIRDADWIPVFIAMWWCVDGSYTVYWSIVNPSVMIREGQWPMSLCLFLLCGAIWSNLAKYPCSWQGAGSAMRELLHLLRGPRA